LFDVEDAVESSSTMGRNKAQLVGLPNGKMLVKIYDWHSYLSEVNLFLNLFTIGK